MSDDSDSFNLSFELPIASELPIPWDEAIEYDNMLSTFWDHKDDEDAEKYLDPIKIFLLSLFPVPINVKVFLGKLEARGRLGKEFDEYKGKGTYHGRDLAGMVKRFEIRYKSPRLYAARLYIDMFTDFELIVVGEGGQYTSFKVHAAVLAKDSLFFKYYCQPGKVSYITTDPDFHPKAVNIVLSWMYGESFDIEDCRRNDGELYIMIYKLLGLVEKLQLHKFVIEATKSFGKVANTWTYDMLPFAIMLYDYNYRYDTGVRFSINQLVSFIHNVYEDGKLNKMSLSINDEKNSDGAREFFCDLSMAFCHYLRPKKRVRRVKTKDLVVQDDAEYQPNEADQPVGSDNESNDADNELDDLENQQKNNKLHQKDEGIEQKCEDVEQKTDGDKQEDDKDVPVIDDKMDIDALDRISTPELKE